MLLAINQKGGEGMSEIREWLVAIAAVVVAVIAVKDRKRH